jgi:hypothetical protein
MNVLPHDFLSTVSCEDGAERISAGYPDECLDFTSFTGSIAALVTEGKWLNNPFTQKRVAIVIDFASTSESEAEASLHSPLNGAWEFPMGCVNTIRSRVETNEQNARIERHLSIVTTGESMREFHPAVIERLLDVHSCRDAECAICRTRFERDLALMFTIIGDFGFPEVHLFSNWEPSLKLRTTVELGEIYIKWNPLFAIPAADLEANRFYSIWDGPEPQYQDFLRRHWAPSWSAPNGGPLFGR